MLDYMVTEAILAKASQRAKKQQKDDKKTEWKDAVHRPGFSHNA